MRKLIEQLTRHGTARPPEESTAGRGGGSDGQETTSQPEEPAPRPVPELHLFFMLSHLEDDGLVRLDGVKLGVCEVMGLEIDEPKLGAFAGALNALDFPAQLLIRQHPPRLDGMREKLREAQPTDLPMQTRAAAESLDRLLKCDSEELLQRIGSLRRLIEVMVGERLSAERRASLDHALAGYYAQPRERTGFRDFYTFLQEDEAGDPDLARLLRPFATGSLRHLLSDEGDDLLGNEALVTVFDLRLLEPELRPAAAMVSTETVWAAAAQDPKPRLLVVDEVWSIMQQPEGAVFLVSVAKRARKHRLGLQFITQDVQDLLSEDTSRAITGHSGRALLQNAAFKLLLQQDAAAVSAVGDAFDLPEDLQRWLLSCPRGDGLLLTKGNRIPIRVEATPEETAVIEWRPGSHKKKANDQA